MKSIFKTLKCLLISLRPLQWLKNLSLYSAIFFGGRFLDAYYLSQVTRAALVFCGISSAMYLINDVVDTPKDRAHPIKRLRPIASGKISRRLALVTVFLLLAVLLPLARAIQPYFYMAVLAYIALQLSYSFYFRNTIILDAITVASGFVLRVFAGGFASSTSISSWLALTTIGLSLLLAFGKRRAEKTALAAEKGLRGITRKTLEHYPESLLNNTLSTSASLTIVAYALFTFQTSAPTTKPSVASLLPSTLSSPKWMMLTIPIVIYGILRYLYIVHEKTEGEAPEKILVADKPLLATILVWAVTAGVFMYVLGT